MLIVTFHGGSDGHPTIAAYTDSGEAIPGEVLAKLHASTPKIELRGLMFAPNGDLWVLNGAKERSEILAYRGSKLPYAFVGQLASYSEVDSLWHPFDLTFSSDPGDLFCYVSNQDTNVVARFAVPAGGKLKAAPHAPALPVGGTFLEGTFVASSNGALPHVKKHTTPIPESRGGLAVEVEDAKKVIHSVRGALWTNGALYVADEPGGAVKVYDALGNYLGHAELPAPVHLLVRAGMLYASTAKGVYWAKLNPRAPGQLTFPPKPGIQVQHASGLAFGTGRSFYVGERTNGKIRWYKDFSPGAPGSAKTFDVASEPEFILYVPDGAPA